ncbi:MAG: four helix bundle protein [Cyanobacteria bacterium J149]|nr:MAG: four helix bundle protein [Cyanobacteria bacterium J149]
MTDNQPIQERTLNFAVRVVKLCQFLDSSGGIAKILASQLIRSGTSIGANVREAQSAQSDKDFLHKMEISLKEARESEYWLIVLVESGVIPPEKVTSLRAENDIIIKILVSITKTIKEKLRTPNFELRTAKTRKK